MLNSKSCTSLFVKLIIFISGFALTINFGFVILKSLKNINSSQVNKNLEKDQEIVIDNSVEKSSFYIQETIVNVHRNPKINSEMVTQALHGEPVAIINRQGLWVQISLPEQYNYQGWVLSSSIKNISLPTQKLSYKIISVSTEEVKESPSTDASVIEILPFGTVLVSEPTKSNEKYTLVHLIDGRKGYISTSSLFDYIQRNLSQVSRKEILDSARQLLGQPYLWGGMTSNGVDCSGFVHTVFKVHGIRLHRDSHLQYDYDGIDVGLENLNPGDLLFFGTDKKRPSHVGIYVGKRRFIHSSSGKGVGYDSLDSSSYSKLFIGAKKIITSQL